VQQCSGGATYIMNATDVTPIVGGVYKVYAPTFIGTMDGINCWVVVSIQNSGLDDNATFGTNYGDCLTCNPTTTSTTTTTTTIAGVVVTNVVGGWTDDGFGNFTPNCFVQINNPYFADITFVTQVELDNAPYVFNSVILAGNTSGGGDGNPTSGFPTAVTNQCIVSCDTPSVDYAGFNCFTPQFYINNSSLDIQITNVIYNGTSPTYLSGQPLPNTTGNGTNLYYGYIGGSYNLDIYWSATIGGQSINVDDSVSAVQCQNTAIGSGIVSFTNVTYNGTNVVQINVVDGTC
jgi:hypothetical protein